MTKPDEYWVTRGYGHIGNALTLSKGPLGLFVFSVLKLGGGITSTYAMQPEYDRSYVRFTIRLPTGKKDELEKLTGITLETTSPPDQNEG